MSIQTDNQVLEDVEKLAIYTEHTSSVLSQSDIAIEFAVVAERHVVRKLDLVVLPLLSLTIMMSYFGRGNIGNARVLGLQKDLYLSNSQFSNVVMIFYVGYAIVELPACLTMKYFHPRYIFGIPTIIFGVLACMNSVAETYAAFMVLRVLTGLGEVFMNNAWIFLAMWYKPSELALRSTAVYSMTPVAGAVSGLLAYACGSNLEGARNMYSWQWLFIIEGAMTVVVGLAVLCFLPGLPDRYVKSSRLFSSEAEKESIKQRSQACRNIENERFNSHQLLIGISDPKMWLLPPIIGTADIGIGAFSIFLPTFIKEFGYGVLEIQLFSIIPYAVGLVTLLIFSAISDRYQRRVVILLPCLAITCIGFAILLTTVDKSALMAGVCLVTAGAYPSLVSGVSWGFSLHAGYTKRSLSISITQIFIQGYSIIATQIYRDPPRFLTGHGVALGLYILGMICAVILYLVCRHTNAQKERRRVSYELNGVVDPDMVKTVEQLCDFHPSYIYALRMQKFVFWLQK